MYSKQLVLLYFLCGSTFLERGTDERAKLKKGVQNNQKERTERQQIKRIKFL
jgi:hypothetical protein